MDNDDKYEGETKNNNETRQGTYTWADSAKRGNVIASCIMVGTKKSQKGMSTLELNENYPMSFYKGDITNAIGKFDPREHFQYIQNQAYTLMGDFIKEYRVGSDEYVASSILKIYNYKDIDRSDFVTACSQMIPFVISELPSFNNLYSSDINEKISAELIKSGINHTPSKIIETVQKYENQIIEDKKNKSQNLSKHPIFHDQARVKVKSIDINKGQWTTASSWQELIVEFENGKILKNVRHQPSRFKVHIGQEITIIWHVPVNNNSPWYYTTNKISLKLISYDKGLEHFNNNDFVKAIEEWEPLAEIGYASAQFSLGRLYSYGNGLEKDDDKAFQLFQLAADQGYAKAQNNVGIMYLIGTSVPIDYKKSFQWFKLAADQGNAKSQYHVGIFYLYGDQGVSKDEKEGCRWLKISAEQGDSWAQFELGKIYFRENGSEIIDANTANHWLRKSANQGNEEAKTFLKNLYFLGYKVIDVKN